MRLTAPTHKRELLAAIAVVALGVLACLLAAGSEADARPSSTAVVPNGTYGATTPRGEYVVFTVRNRKVRDLEFQIRIVCQATDSPVSEERFFSAGAQAPQGHTIPASGKLMLNWQERGGGRLGRIGAELKFGVRDVANFGVIVPEEPGPEAEPEEAKESCDGVGAIRFHRGFELTPMPLSP